MKRKPVIAWTALLLIAGIAGTTAIHSVRAQPQAEDGAIARGRYLVRTSGCNDCHTPGYLQVEGRTPESEWLTGAAIGFQGPWGTTYPANLRRYVQGVTEDVWLARARQPARPPMPWFNLAAMTDDDLRAIYRYVRSLGAKGEAAPGYVAAGDPVGTPVFVFVPQQPALQQTRAAR